LESMRGTADPPAPRPLVHAAPVPVM
jgi:hypothetical protein